MPNPYATFQRLLPKDPMLVGTVTSLNGDGSSTVELPGGERIRVQGQGVAVSSKAFVKGGEIKGEAPNLPVNVVIIP